MWKRWVCGQLTALKRRVRRLEKKVPLTQEQIDALRDKVAADDQRFLDFATTVTAEIEALKAENPDLDLSGLEAAVEKLTSDLDTTPVP